MNSKLEKVSALLIESKDTGVEAFNKLSLKEKSYLVSNIPASTLEMIIPLIDLDDLAEIVNLLDPDVVADVVQCLDLDKQNKILESLQAHTKEVVDKLLSFAPDSAGGLMNTDYIQTELEDSIESVITKFKKHEERTGRPPVILVVQKGDLIGYLPGYKLVVNSDNKKIDDLFEQIKTVKHNTSAKKLVSIFKRNPHKIIAVLDEKDGVVGIVFSDDILKLLDGIQGDNLYKFAGVSKEEEVMDEAKTKVKFRYKWLILNLGTAFFAASIVGLFNDVISKYVILAMYMPIVAGMGGNSATQTLAVVVRGISSHPLKGKNIIQVLKNEVLAGFINGVINAVIVSFVVIFFNQNLKVAMILSIAMITNLVVAGFFGTLIPIFMQKLGKDPASSATILITTATDVLGFLTFLGLASIILQ